MYNKQQQQQAYFSHFAQLNTFIRYKNNKGEHWLPRITEELIMIGSQYAVRVYFEGKPTSEKTT